MKTKVILEFCYNHNGNLQNARNMIDEAHKLGVYAVKFQKWDIDSFPDNIKDIQRKDKHSFGKTYYNHRKYLELDLNDLMRLKWYAEEKGLEFICSGKDLNSIKQIHQAGIKNIKIPSQKLLDDKIYNYLKDKDVFTMISTGMHFDEEIRNSKWVNDAEVVFHCISDYPANLNDCDLGFMRSYPFYNGYSSHEFEGRAIKYAIVAGADFIERHYTLDKSMKGTDHIVSSDYKEMKHIIEDIKEVELILGDGSRKMNNREIVNRNYYKEF